MGIALYDNARNAVAYLRRVATNLLVFRKYDAGAINTENYKWLPPTSSADSELATDGNLMRARARDLVNNDPIACAALDAWCRMVVGNGIPVFADCRDPDSGEVLDDLNDAMDEYFDEWAENALFESGIHWYDAQRLMFQEIVTAGDAILLECLDDGPSRTSPLCYQLVEIEQLDDYRYQSAGPNTNEIRYGIEMDNHQRPLAYWLFDHHPHEVNGAPPISKAYSADRVVHLFWRRRPSQTRGASWFHPVIKHIANMGGYLRSELSSARAASNLAFAIHRQYGAGSGMGLTGRDGDTTSSDAAANSLQVLGQPIIADLAAGDEIKPIESARPGHAHAAAWLKFMLTLMASGTRLSYQSLTREATGTFSGNKATRVIDDESISPIYQWFSRQCCVPVRSKVIVDAIARGEFIRYGLSPSKFMANPRQWLKHAIPDGKLTWMDPQKESEGNILALTGWLRTFSDIHGAMGKNWRKQMRQVAKEQAYAAKLGLKVWQFSGQNATASPNGKGDANAVPDANADES